MGRVPRDRPRRSPLPKAQARQLEAENERLQRQLGQQLEQLERERDFIRTVVDAASAVFGIVDPEGRIVRYNYALARLSGRVDDDVTRGKPFWDVFVHPPDARAVREALLGADGVEHEHRFRRHGGGSAVVAWSRAALVDDAGRPRVLFTGVDVSARKEQEDELRASRTRIVEAADAARRRIERDLHDGAQQRLVTLSLALRIARSAVASGDAAAADEQLRTVEAELAEALGELRELARGIHPAVLTERGLPDALESLAVRSHVPVEVREVPQQRFAPQLEAAIYYVVAEGLTNVTKYARADVASVRVFHENGRMIAEIEDDGVGGADASAGTGLRGLVDRVEALGGTLAVESPRGVGTTIRAEIPALS
jgi:PAS domain S-box-containing protein